MIKLMTRLANDEAGATAVEYGLLAGLVGMAAVGAVSAVGVGISGVLTVLANLFAGLGNP